MSDLANLQIQITAATSQADNAIDKLISNLGRLNNALSNYGDTSNYVKGLTNLANGLNGIADAVLRIDTNQIKGMASALKSLSGAGDKLSNMTVAKSLTNMAQSAETASSRFRQAAEEMASRFQITDKGAIADLTDSIQMLYSNMDNPQAVKKAESDIHGIIDSYYDFGEAVDETYDKVREFVSGSKIFLSEMDVAEYGDAFKTIRGYIGINNTTTKRGNGGVGLDTWINDFLEQFKGVIPYAESTQEILGNLADYLANGKMETDEFADAMAKSESHIIRVDQAIDRMCQSLGILRARQEEASGSDFIGAGSGNILDEEDLVFGNEDYGQTMEATATSAAHASNEIGLVADKVAEVREEVSTEIANPFEGIINGLLALQGVSITADQFSGVKEIAEALGKFSGSKASSAASVLPFIASGLEQLSQVSVPNIAPQLEELGAGIGKLGSAAATRAQGLSFVADGLRQLQGIGNIPQIEGLSELAQSLAMFGRQTAQQAVEIIPQLATAFRNLIETLASSPNVSRNVIDLANAMASMSTAGTSVARSSTSASRGMNLFGNSARKAHHHTKSLAYMFGKLYASYFLVIRAFRMLGKAIDVSSQLTEVQNVVDTVFGDASDRVEDFAQTAILSFGMSELSAKQFASRFQAMGKAMGITSEQVGAANEFIAKKTEGNARAYEDLGDSLADMSINLTKLTADMASFYNKDYTEVAEDMEAILTGMTRPLRKYGLDLTEATLKEWALKNGLDADIDSMSQAQKTMLRYQYVMAQTGHVMGDFEKTADTWANVTRTIGQQFQKMGQIIGEGLINTFRPYALAFRDFMNSLIGMTEKTLNAVGHLLGWEIQLERVGTTLDDDMGDYADSLDDAGGKAKKLKDYLLGIDELNVFSPDTKGSGSGSGLGGAGLYGESSGIGAPAFEMKKYASAINSWFELGSKISEKIREGLESIDWDDAFVSASKFGENFAKFLNGLFKPSTFEEVGKTIANLMNKAIYNALSFSKNFDFKQAGTAVGKAINGWLETIDIKASAKAISNFAKGILEWITSALKTVNWRKLGENIGIFISEIDWSGILINFGKLAWSIVTGIADALIGLSAGNPLVGAIATLFTGAFAAAKVVQTFSTITTAFKGFSTVVEAFTLANPFGVIALAIGGVVTAIGAMVIAQDAWAQNQVEYWKHKEMDEYGETLDNISQMYSTLAQEAEESAKRRKETVGNSTEELDQVHSLAIKYLELSQNANLTEEEYGELLLASQKLVKYFPELRDMYNEETGLLDVQADTLKELIKEKEKEIKLNALSDAWTEAIKGQINAQKALDDATANLNKALDDQAYWQKQVNDYIEEYGTNVGADELMGNLELATEAVDTFTQAQEDAKTAFDAFSGEVDYYETQYARLVKNTEDAGKSIEEFGDTIVETADESGDAVQTNSKNSKEAVVTNMEEAKKSAEKYSENIRNSIVTNMEEAQKSAENYMKSISKSVRDYSEDAEKSASDNFGKIGSAFQKLKDAIGKGISGNIGVKINSQSVEAYAQGGFPEAGSLFIAGEAGAELVGSIGGSTAVVNNEQIVESVSAGVQNAVATVLTPYLAQIATNTGETARKDLTVNIGDRDIALANQRGVSQLGLAIIS